MIQTSEITVKVVLKYDDEAETEYDVQQTFLNHQDAHHVEIVEGYVDWDGVTG